MKRLIKWSWMRGIQLITYLGLLVLPTTLAFADGSGYHGEGMMGGSWGFWMGFGWLWMLLLIALIVLAIAALVKYISGSGSSGSHTNHGQEDPGSGRRA
ncbi:MAG TPA: hypothetical protein ENI60_00660 [Candidatus Fraserbacteria bacterium]|nr:hypothetical protein [Candidatus Fraserbacteria bacterium]